MRLALAVQMALVLTLAGALLFRMVAPSPSYETLSRPEEQGVTDRAQLHVVFSEDITGKEVRELLQDIDAQIVQGPSLMGVYTLRMGFVATATGRTNAALTRVRACPKVRFAEIFEGGIRQ
jgi:hypothetical protein